MYAVDYYIKICMHSIIYKARLIKMRSERDRKENLFLELINKISCMY